MDRVADFERLSPAAQKLLLARLKKREEAQAQVRAIPPSPRRASGEPFPLSFAQQRLWFLGRLDPESYSYNVAQVLRLAGRLDRAALSAALDEIVRRHEALRLELGEVDGRAVQTVRPPFPVDLPEVDLTVLPAARRAAAEEEVLFPFVLAPYELAAGPHLRACLVRSTAANGVEEVVLVLGMHHIVSDGWSVGLVVRELTTLYTAFVSRQPSPLPPLPIQYPDFADWQRQTLSGDRLEAELGYWRDHLAGAPRVLDLPADRPRPPVKSERGHRLLVTLPAAEALFAALSPEPGTTRFMILLAGFGLFVARLTGQEDLLIGTPVANRTRAETEGLIGFFVNTLALRLDLRSLGEKAGFHGVAAAVRRETLAAQAHQDLPFERLVEELNPGRDLSRSPLFQVSCSLLDVAGIDLTLPGLEARPFDVEARTALFDLELEGIEKSDGSLVLEWRYSADLFEGTTIARWARAFEGLLAAAAAEPERPWTDLPLLPESERHQLFAEWSGGVEEGTGELLHAAFERRAREAPDRAAVVSRDLMLTYGELARRVEEQARALAALGVGPEVRVGLALPRSAGMIVAILAVLRAGGAFVPLDPGQPAERLAFVLRDAIASCCPGLVLAGRGALAHLPEIAGVRVVEPAELPRLAPAAAAGRPSLHAGLGAYCLYTSGSTGNPKGVLVPHAAAAGYVRDAVARYGLSREDRIPQVSAVTFDASLDEIFLPLAAGGAVILGPTTEDDPARYVERSAELGATVLSLPTAYWHLLAAAVAGGLTLPGVRAVVMGGEKALAELWFSWEVPAVELFNSYGPTEAVVAVATAKRGGDPGVARSEAPVGWPLGSNPLYVLDRRLQPLPLGVPGELLAGGAGLARGYLDRPDLTARAFVPDPFSRTAGARLYRTGDLARHLPDGRLEVLGRLDAQVKIRGFRIELGEIEAVLVTHPAVAGAAVVAAGEAGNRRGLWLAAFAVARGDEPTAADLQAYLAARLPEAMVPQEIFFLETLPLTPNGKIDRADLAGRAAALAGGERRTGGAPRGAVEELLAGLWAELLEVQAVSREDDFFSLGGHSLLATQLVARVRNAFGVELPQRALFEAPTLAGLAARIEEQGRGEAPPIPPPAAFARGAVPGGGSAARPPLSFAQERLWLIDRVEPESNAYNMPVALRLRGTLDRPALAAAWSELARRHESLRTRFGVERGVPFQQIGEAAPVPLPCVDLTALPAEVRGLEAARLAQEEGLRPFDLAHDPVLRVCLLALGESEHDLLFTVHHIASDGWSNGVLVREMVAFYGAFGTESPSPLPPLPLSYADYARWQRATLAGERLESLLAFYRRELADLPVLELPTDRPRTAVPAASGALATIALPGELVDRLHGLCREAGVTLFMALMAAFQGVVGRTAGATDFGVGTPVAGRRFVELEGLIGFFVNTLVLRADLAGEPSGLVLLERVRKKALAAFAHQDVPFEKLVSELNPERSLTHTPLFQVMCILQNAPDPPVVLPGLEVAPLPPAAVTAKFDLTLSWSEVDGTLAGVVEYRPDLFDAATIERFLARMQVFLAGLAAEPGLPLADLPLLPEAEWRAVLFDWSAARVTPPAASFDELFFGERALALDPAAPALVHEGGELSRRELTDRVFALARALRAAGAGPDVRVAVCLPRSAEMVVAILGVLAAGAVYVPLDPGYPADRLAFMLEDSTAAVLLTDRDLVAGLPPFSGPVLEIGPALAAGLSQTSGLPVGPAPQPENLAYVCYTSGSTGRPKGVAMPRGALANLLAWQVRDLPGTARTLQFSPVSFDVSFQEIGSAWTAGGALVLVDEETRRDPEALLDHLERHRVERLFLPFVALRHLAEAAAARGGESRERGLGLALRDVITAGEPLHSTPAVVAFFAALPGCRLHNHYGPTETHAATGLRLPADPTAWPPLPPVGRPIANARVLLLDAGGRQPVPLGSAGELYVGGAGLARGYLGRPDLTAERFVPDPWGPPGERLYRTGDLARFLPDGVIDLAGRADDQVKIRGIRIEPGEVEAVLAAHPGVRQAVVAAREEGGVKRLLAWFLPAGEPVPHPAELRAWVGDRLPPAFVPAAFVAVESFPLTPSGKVNRRVLTAQPVLLEGGGSDVPYAAPRGLTEELLAAAWGELLGVTRVGRHDHFFDSGGHSLLASQLVSRVRELFGREVPQRAIFEEPTLAGLAARIDEAGPGGVLAPIGKASAQGPFPLSFAQERLWMLDRLQPGQSTYNLPLALRLTGELDIPALAASLTEIVRRHEPLRTTYHFRRTPGRSDGWPVQEVEPARPVTIPVVDLSALPPEVRGEEGWWLAFEEAEEPFDLERGPIFRVCLLRLTPAEHALLWNVHHIASDGWSHGVMVAEVAELYAAATEGRAARLPELPVRYVDYAAWQRETLTEEVLASGIAVFRRAFEGCRPLELPADHERPARPSGAGGSVEVRLASELTDGLAHLCREQGATLFMGTAALFATLLARLSGQTDFPLGTVLAGRGRAELEGLIGFFINALPLPIHLSTDAGFADLLAGVREGALEAFAHQYVPFERLVEELAPERNPAETPLIQAMCVLQNTPVTERELPGLALAPIALDTTTAKFDLTLSLSPGEELTGGLEFRTDLFDPETIERWIGHLETLLTAALAEPARPLGRLPLLTEAERQEILAGRLAAGGVLVLDESLEPVPPGVTGDLYERVAEGDCPEADEVVEIAGVRFKRTGRQGAWT